MAIKSIGLNTRILNKKSYTNENKRYRADLSTFPCPLNKLKGRSNGQFRLKLGYRSRQVLQ